MPNARQAGCPLRATTRLLVMLLCLCPTCCVCCTTHPIRYKRSASNVIVFMPHLLRLLHNPSITIQESSTNVIVFMPHLFRLLHNPSITIQVSLVLDVKCPFKPFASRVVCFPQVCINRGVYTIRNATQSNQLLVPIIQWTRIPRPHGTGSGRLSMDHGFLPKTSEVVLDTE